MAKDATVTETPGSVSTPSRDGPASTHGDVEKTGQQTYVNGTVTNNDAQRHENFYTRNGLNLESFQKRSYGYGLIELDRSMKHRHLQMIAIGKIVCRGAPVCDEQILTWGFRWLDWCWFLRRFWRCFRQWRKRASFPTAVAY
jgi:yeast amino acid transporter